ncbi:MAG: dUTP diphosphatase [Pseudomonadota bacterium]
MTENPQKITKMQLCIKQLPHAEDLPLPEYQTSGASGFDVRAALGEGETITLNPGEHKLIPTGLSFELPLGFEAQVRPRSGLAFKHGITVLNSPGTIDSDYRGEVKIILTHLGTEPFNIEHGMRIAQIVIQQVVQAEIQAVDIINTTERNKGGFGSTGV